MTRPISSLLLDRRRAAGGLADCVRRGFGGLHASRFFFSSSSASLEMELKPLEHWSIEYKRSLFPSERDGVKLCRFLFSNRSRLRTFVTQATSGAADVPPFKPQTPRGLQPDRVLARFHNRFPCFWGSRGGLRLMVYIISTQMGRWERCGVMKPSSVPFYLGS